MRRVLAVLAVATTAAVGWAATAMATVSTIDVDCTHAVAHWFSLPSAQTIRTRVVIDGFEVADLEQQGGPGLFDATASWVPLGPGRHTISVATWRDGGAGHATVTVDCTPAVVAPPTVAPPVVVPPAQPVAPRAHGHKRHATPRHRAQRECKAPRRMLAGKCRRVVSRRVPRTAG